MITLGIGGSEHDFSCALCIDGKLMVAIEEERITRKKHGIGIVQSLEIGKSVDYCLEYCNLGRKDVDYVVGNDLIKVMPLFGFSKYELMNHHLSHLYSTYFMSGFSESAILIVDAAGSIVDGKVETATLAYGNGTKISILKKIYGIEDKVYNLISNSIGQLYTLVTEKIGFKILQEGKTMGLAPYGRETYVPYMESIIELMSNGEYIITIDNLIGCSCYIESELSKYEKEELFQAKADFAYAIQKVTDKVILHLTRALSEMTNSMNLCYAGGVALNSVTNGKLAKTQIFKNHFVQPAAGDSGTSVGAALYGFYYHSQSENIVKQDNIVFLGKKYSVVEIKNAIDKLENVYNISCEDNICKRLAYLLSRGEIVCIFNGRSEFGPRALGHRSIISGAEHGKKGKMNEIKQREKFRPFAPAVLNEMKQDFFENNEYRPYMLFVESVNKMKSMLIPSVTHVDSSARVQSVLNYDNPYFYNLIFEYYKLTGIPVVLNTSFNIGYEPIVETPVDAINSFNKSTLKWLALENYLLEKK